MFNRFRNSRSKNVIVVAIKVNESTVGKVEIDYRGHMKAEIYAFLGQNEMTQVVGFLHRMNNDLGFRPYNLGGLNRHDD